MTPCLLISCLLPIPLCAQAPPTLVKHPVRVLLLAEKPPAGTPALDTAAIAEKLKVFANGNDLTLPEPDGDGWVLGIGLTTQEESDGLLVGGGAVRLSRLSVGKVVPQGEKDTGALVVARNEEDLCSALGDELIHRCGELLTAASIVSKKSLQLDQPVSATAPTDGKADPTRPHRFDFAQVKVRGQLGRFNLPTYSKKNRIQGTVIVDVSVGPDGVPISAAATEGPGPLLAYACEWALHWRFDPLTINDHPVYGKVKIDINFRPQ